MPGIFHFGTSPDSRDQNIPMTTSKEPAPQSAVWTIVPAAGIGSRMGSAIPKQYLTLLGRPVIEHTLTLLLSHPAINTLYLPLDTQDSHWPQLALAQDSRIRTVAGGQERCHSVLNALHEIAGQAHPQDWVLVHDVARPCLWLEDLDRLFSELADDDVGGLLGVPVADTLKRTDEHGRVRETIDRRQVWRAYTPQMFRFGVLYEALQDALAQNALVTDEASAVERAGFCPRMVQGRGDNIKITVPSDLVMAELYLRQRPV